MPGSFRAPPPPDALRDMRTAYSKKPLSTDSEAVKKLREFFTSSPGQFLTQLNKMEADHKAAIAAARALWDEARGVSVDEHLGRGPSEERLVGVIESLLTRYEAKS